MRGTIIAPMLVAYGCLILVIVAMLTTTISVTPVAPDKFARTRLMGKRLHLVPHIKCPIQQISPLN